jgi:putative ABC transport system substrate-binding protein
MQFDRLKRREFITLVVTASAWPLAARAQQPAMPVIGFLSGASLLDREPLLPALRQGLSTTGFIEGQNVAIEYRYADGQYDRFPLLIADLLRRKVAVIVAGDGPSAMAAKEASSTTPIVFNTGGDPVQIGLVTDLSRPGANLTGVNLVAGPLPAKQFGLLHELVPAAKTIALLINPKNANAEHDAAIVREAAGAVGVQIVVLSATAESDFNTAFVSLDQARAGALVVNSDVFFTIRRDQLVALAARHGLPTIFPFRQFAVAGGLMSYGPSIAASYHQVGIYTGRILKGEKPGDLPVMQATKFEFVINLNTARAFGLSFPPGLLAIADEVIE